MIARWSALLIASLAAVGTVPAAATAQQAQTLRPCEKLYAVVHRVTVDEEGRVTETAVEHVVDPARGRTAEEAAANPIQMDLPPAYLAAARAHIERRTYPGAPTTFWTYTLFDPAQPARASIGSAEDCRPQPTT